MEKVSIIEAFQTAHDEYFRLFLKNYPSIPSCAPFADFGPPELCNLAIEVHSCAIALGTSARERLLYLGLELLYPFDNPVDHFNWRAFVKNENINHTTYASIAIRIDSELKRMRRVFELGGEVSYDAVPSDIFLVSKTRYKLIEVSDGGNEGDNKYNQLTPPPRMHIDTVNIHYAADSQAVSQLEKVEKGTAIGSNFSNIISALRVLMGG